MKVSHIDIPCDELLLFRQEEKYQIYLAETLLYSTKVVWHSGEKTNCALLAVTKHHLWLELDEGKQPRLKLPMIQIEAVIRCLKYPEMVLLTSPLADNVRITTTSEERCNNLLSALAYYRQYLTGKKELLKLHVISQDNLLYFQRSVKDKATHKVRLDHYPNTLLRYEPPQNSPTIYGNLLLSKMVLSKQLYEEQDHMIHIAKVNEEDYYLCHTLEADRELETVLRSHENIEHVQKLLYARKLQHKIQLFFQLHSAVKPDKITASQLFSDCLHLYDLVKNYEIQDVLTLQMLCEVNGRAVLRQFRYAPLRIENELSRFICTREGKKGESESERYLKGKLYNIALVVYRFVFGRGLFQHEQVMMMVLLKESCTIVFPKYQANQGTPRLRNFIQKCILGQFHNLDDLRSHKWIVEERIPV